MKSRHKIGLRSIVFMGSFLQTSYAQLQVPGEPTIYNDSQAQYIQANGLDNPIRAGAYAAIRNPDSQGKISEIEGVQGLDNQIDSHTAAKIQTLQIINNMINYALSLLSFVALIYLMYHGFIILTAAGDDSKYKEGLKGIKYALIAIGGIGLSWIFISTIFWVVNSFANGKTPEGAPIKTSMTQITNKLS